MPTSLFASVDLSSITIKCLTLQLSIVLAAAIAISNDRNFFFIFGFGNSTIFPSVGISELISENESKNIYRVFGSYINNSTRYGDYFGSAIDPIDGSVWFSGEYVDGSISIPIPSEFKGIYHMREKTWSTIMANIS